MIKINPPFGDRLGPLFQISEALLWLGPAIFCVWLVATGLPEGIDYDFDDVLLLGSQMVELQFEASWKLDRVWTCRFRCDLSLSGHLSLGGLGVPGWNRHV